MNEETQDKFTEECTFCQEYVCECSERALEFKLGGSRWGASDPALKDFMGKVARSQWAWKYADKDVSVDDIVQDAMVKYLELQETEPGEHPSYYMTAAKNNCVSLWRKRQVRKFKTVEYAAAPARQLGKDDDKYMYEFFDWFDEQSHYAKDAIIETLQFKRDNPGKNTPERLQRRLRKIGTRP